MTRRSETVFPFGARVGILGGGQLARMLVLKGHEMGLVMHVLCPSAAEPAAQVTPHVHLGDPANRDDLVKFAQSVDVLTLESEFHAGGILAQAVRDSGTPLFPSPTAVTCLQDRAPQKEALVTHRVPTAPFLRVESADDLETAFATFEGRFVLKKRRGGYDGYGTHVVRSRRDLNKIRAQGMDQDSFIAEAFIPFRRELAVQMARNRSGQVEVFPLVETHQVDHRLDWLRGPISHGAFENFRRRLIRFVHALDYVGVIAFELFDTGRDLLVNEVAPRVHNSGHGSLEALTVDQFSQHLRAVLDLDLIQAVPLTGGFATVNLIGGGARRAMFPRALRGHVHWYGKAESRAGRKMGHLTTTASTATRALQTALTDRKGFKL